MTRAAARIPAGFSLPVEDFRHIVEHVGETWRAYRDARIFITGGTGFFGLWLTEALLWASRELDLRLEITILSRSPKAFLSARGRHLADHAALHFLQGAVSDFEATGRYTHIIHAASESDADGSVAWAQRHISAALDGSLRVIDLAIKSQATLLVTTSGAIYSLNDRIVDGRCVEGPSSLEDFVTEKHTYGEAKRMMELVAAVAARSHGFGLKIARCFCFVGPYLPLQANYAIGNFILDAMNGRDIVVKGDGTPLRSYLYMADLVVWLLTILARGETGRPYNVGGDRAISIGQLAAEVAAEAGTGSRVVIMQTPKSGIAPGTYLPSLERARNDLDLQVRIDLASAIRRTIDWERLRSSAPSMSA